MWVRALRERKRAAHAKISLCVQCRTPKIAPQKFACAKGREHMHGTTCAHEYYLRILTTRYQACILTRLTHVLARLFGSVERVPARWNLELRFGEWCLDRGGSFRGLTGKVAVCDHAQNRKSHAQNLFAINGLVQEDDAS